MSGTVQPYSGTQHFPNENKQLYLSIDYEKPTSKLTADNKSKLDEDFRIKVQAVSEKLKIVQHYVAGA